MITMSKPLAIKLRKVKYDADFLKFCDDNEIFLPDFELSHDYFLYAFELFNHERLSTLYSMIKESQIP